MVHLGDVKSANVNSANVESANVKAANIELAKAKSVKAEVIKITEHLNPLIWVFGVSVLLRLIISLVRCLVL
jgi:hypothetical protein